MGAEFSKYYSYSEDNIVFTLSRKNIDVCKNTQHVMIDLLNNNQIQKKILPILVSLKDTLV
ncbi:MAG: hypothetical protein WCL18_01115 [bacterium]